MANIDNLNAFAPALRESNPLPDVIRAAAHQLAHHLGGDLRIPMPTVRLLLDEAKTVNVAAPTTHPA